MGARDAVYGDDVELRTERLLLRRWRPSDRPLFAAMNADPVVTAHVPALDRAGSDAFVDRIEARFDEHGFGLWAVEAPVVGFVGYTGLWPVPDTAPGAGGWEIGWRLARAAWGHGYATEAALAVRDLALGELEIPELWSLTTVDNLRSQAVMERIGLVRHSLYGDGFVAYRTLSGGVPRRRSASTGGSCT